MGNAIPDLTIDDAARLLKVSSKTVTRWIAAGTLEAVKVGGRYRTTLEWIHSTIVELPPAHGEVQRNARRNEKAAQKRLEAKWGFRKKMPRAELSASR